MDRSLIRLLIGSDIKGKESYLSFSKFLSLSTVRFREIIQFNDSVCEYIIYIHSRAHIRTPTTYKEKYAYEIQVFHLTLKVFLKVK